MGMYTGIRFKGYIKEKHRKSFKDVALLGLWIDSEVPILREFGEKYWRAEFIPCGGLSYMPKSWSFFDESLEKFSKEWFRSEEATDGFHRSYNTETGYWTFQCSLKSYEDEVEAWLNIIPSFVERVEHLEILYEEDDGGTVYDLVAGRLIRNPDKTIWYNCNASPTDEIFDKQGGKGKMLILTHNDLDGYGSNIVAKTLKLSHDVENLNNNEVEERVATLLDSKEYRHYERIIMTDLSISPELAIRVNELSEQGDINFVVLDHHKTAEHLKKYEWAKIIMDNTHSGTTLFLEYCCEELGTEASRGLDSFTRIVRDYDTWAWKKNGNTTAKLTNDLFMFYSNKEDFIESIYDNIILFDDTNFTLTKEQLSIVNTASKVNSNYIGGKIIKTKIVEIEEVSNLYKKDMKIGLTVASRNTSLLGNSICNSLDVDLAMILNLDRDTVSLRSVGDVADVSILAKEMGGGGHRNAAGYPANKKMELCLVEKYIGG